jgi:arsenate reductase (glutaredoxin)
MLTVYHYPKCSTCRNALRWMDAHGIRHERVDIVEKPPSIALLRQALDRSGLPIARLFNTSGQSYRDGNYKERLPQMSREEALAALAADGKLIKRPLVLSSDVALVGFDEGKYGEALDALRATGKGERATRG